MSNDTGVPYVFGADVLSAAIALPIAGLIAVALRFWVRVSREQGIRWDDWLISAALAFEAGMSACLIYGVAEKAVGYPTPPLPVHKSSPAKESLTETTPKEHVVFLVYWVMWILMIPANGLIKLSAILLYRRIFVVTKGRYFDWLSKSLFVICLLWTIAFFFAQVFGCGTHFSNAYHDLATERSCANDIRLNGLMLSDLLTDILVWIMPAIMVWQLQMKWTKKLHATAVLSLAAMSVAAAIVRLVVEFEIAYGGYAAQVDTDLVLTINLYWSMLESGLAVIAACLPIICVPIYHLLADLVESAIKHVRGVQGPPSWRNARHSSSETGKTLHQSSVQKNSTTCDSIAPYRDPKDTNGNTLGIVVEKQWDIREESAV